MRLIAAWGVPFADWDDKAATHRFVWEQAEIVRKLRERLREFPGTETNLDAPVSAQLEGLANAVLLAPSFQDAVDGIGVLSNALTKAYAGYAEFAHAVHDAPTLAVLREIGGLKESRRLWLRDYRRRYPYQTDASYRAALGSELEACGNLGHVLEVEEAARPAGVRTDFKMPCYKSYAWATPKNIMPDLHADFVTSIEARRLFWCYGYMLEFNLAETMLQWVWAAHYMPWEYQGKLARHLWDESRHGQSGRSRLLDFGIEREDFGCTPFSRAEFAPVDALTPQQLYQAAWEVGLIAETGHFTVKNEAYADFKAGGDLESAEMVLFDVIDEGAHVQYCHEWLPELARRCGAELGNYREQAVKKRAEHQAASDARRQERLRAHRDESDAAYALYQRFLETMRRQQPLSNAETCPPRSGMPM
jgi:hypothetical protein